MSECSLKHRGSMRAAATNKGKGTSSHRFGYCAQRCNARVCQPTVQYPSYSSYTALHVLLEFKYSVATCICTLRNL